MEPPDLERAVEAAISIVVELDLHADRATIVQNSNKLALRLLPCDVFARVAPAEHRSAKFEVSLAQGLAKSNSPVTALEPRVEPRVYELDDFEVTFWTYYEPAIAEISPPAYADALERLHGSMRTLDVTAPHFTDRIGEAQRIVSSSAGSPALSAAEREMLARTLQRLRRAILAYEAPEQLLHGEPHPGNVLSTASGPRFIDLETCCRGPVEFDLAHVPRRISEHYPGLDPALLRDCRQLVLAMVAAWRWDLGDQFPDGLWFGRELMSALREGPPWPTIGEVFSRLDPS